MSGFLQARCNTFAQHAKPTMNKPFFDLVHCVNLLETDQHENVHVIKSKLWLVSMNYGTESLKYITNFIRKVIRNVDLRYAFLHQGYMMLITSCTYIATYCCLSSSTNNSFFPLNHVWFSKIAWARPCSFLDKVICHPRAEKLTSPSFPIWLCP